MSVLVDWGDSDEIILLWRFDSKWTWRDARFALNQSRNLVEGTTQIVVLIVDMRRIEVNPNGLLKHLPELYNNLPQEVSRVVFIDEGSMFYSLFQMLKFQHPAMMQKCHLVDNVDDAYRLVNLVTA